MKRSILLLTAFAAIVVLLAAPAFAKGADEEQIEGHIVITGPGLDEPIDLTGTYSAFAFSRETHPSTFGRLLRDLGLARFAQGSTGFWTIPPHPAMLGPRYEIQLFIGLEATTTPIREDFYPYAEGGPKTYPLPGQSIEGAMVPTLWYSPPPVVLTVLISMGLPSKAPAVAGAQPAAAHPANEVPSVASPPRSSWRWLFALGGLMTLLLVGALAGRGRAMPTA